MGRLYDLARGEVRLRISGPEPEKALNICAEKGIKFKDAAPNRDFAVELTVRAADYPELCALNGLDGLSVELLSSRGGRELTKAIKRRLALIISFSLCVLTAAVSSLFVWDIDIEGNGEISDAELLRVLKDCGLEYGSFRLTLDTESVRNKLLLSMPELSWMTVNIGNSRAQVLVHERVKKPELLNDVGTCDIRAEKSGIITKMSVLQGNAAVKVGDTVVKGQTLVSGTMESETGDTRYVRAAAVIEARTWYEISAQTPLFEDRKTDTGRTKRKIALVIGKNHINFGSDSRNMSAGCDKIVKLRYLGISPVFTLPVGLLTERCSQSETGKLPIDRGIAVKRLEQTLTDELTRRIDGGSIEESHFTVSDDGEKLTVTLRAECLENIAEEN